MKRNGKQQGEPPVETPKEQQNKPSVETPEKGNEDPGREQTRELYGKAPHLSRLATVNDVLGEKVRRASLRSIFIERDGTLSFNFGHFRILPQSEGAFLAALKVLVERRDLTANPIPALSFNPEELIKHLEPEIQRTWQNGTYVDLRHGNRLHDRWPERELEW